MSAPPPTWTFRFTRAIGFSLISAGMGTVAHVLGGGCLTRPTMVAGVGISFAAGLFLSRRERSLRSILPVLGAVQLGQHLYFGYACAGGGSSFAETFEHLHHQLHHAPVPGAGMIIMHGWAVTLVALWLARGESALWSLVRRVGARLAALVFGRPALRSTGGCGVRASGPEVVRPALLRQALHLRGPPLSTLAVAR